VVYPVPTNKAMTKESQRYNRFIRHGGNVISKHICPEDNVAILPLNSSCSGFVTHTGEILTTGKPHQKKPEGLFPKGREFKENYRSTSSRKQRRQ